MTNLVPHDIEEWMRTMEREIRYLKFRFSQPTNVVALVTDTSFSFTSASTTPVVVTDLTLASVPVISGRRYRVDMTLTTSSTVTTDLVAFEAQVDTGTWNTIGAFTRRANSSTLTASTGNMPGTIAFYYLAAATGTVGFRVQFFRALGTGTVTASASAGNVAALQVTDLGVV